MADARPAGTSQDRGRRMLVGALLAIVGLVGLVGLFVVSNASGDTAARLALSLGLAGSVLLSAVFQILLAVGVWMAWSARRRNSRTS